MFLFASSYGASNIFGLRLQKQSLVPKKSNSCVDDSHILILVFGLVLLILN